MKWKLFILAAFLSCYLLQGAIWVGEWAGFWRWGHAKTFQQNGDNAQNLYWLTFIRDAKVNRHLVAVGHDKNGWQTFRWEPPIKGNQ